MIRRYKDIIKIITYFLLVPLVVWGFSLDKTVDIWQEYKNNQAELRGINIESIPKQTIKQKRQGTDSLLDFVSKDNNVEIVKYNRYTISKMSDYTLIANELILRSDYFSLLKLSNSIERSWDIRSLSFYTEMNYKEKREYLYTQIIITNTSN